MNERIFMLCGNATGECRCIEPLMPGSMIVVTSNYSIFKTSLVATVFDAVTRTTGPVSSTKFLGTTEVITTLEKMPVVAASTTTDIDSMIMSMTAQVHGMCDGITKQLVLITIILVMYVLRDSMRVVYRFDLVRHMYNHVALERKEQLARRKQTITDY